LVAFALATLGGGLCVAVKAQTAASGNFSWRLMDLAKHGLAIAMAATRSASFDCFGSSALVIGQCKTDGPGHFAGRLHDPHHGHGRF
jgi:hypothetical protein